MQGRLVKSVYIFVCCNLILGWGSNKHILQCLQYELALCESSSLKMAAEWKQKCDSDWGLGARSVPMPDSVDWKSVYEKKPFERNLLQNPAPYGVSHTNAPPELNCTGELPPADRAPRFEPDGNFSGWSTSTEVLPYDTSGIPPGVVICSLPQFRWFTLEQRVDLKAEGLWDQLLDEFQPEIVIEDWYEESQLHNSIYLLDVKLLGADGKTVIKEHSSSPEENLECYSHTWKKVSHVFSKYGPGVRYIHFLHRLKNKFMVDFFNTTVTDSSIVIKVTK